MEVTIERIQDETDERCKGYHEDFTVFINGKRILSVFSDTDPVATKWISEVRKACRKKKGPVIAGVSVDRDIHYGRGGVSDNPYETLTLCVGSHCLICSLPYCWTTDGKYGRSDETSKVLRDFLADRNVIFIGIDTEEVSQRLERFQNLKIARSGDVRALAVKLLKEERGSVSDKLAKSLSLDDVAKQVLDKRMDVDRPKKMDRWNRWNYWGCRTFESHKEVRRFVINREYVKFQTLDAYLCHEIGIKYLDEFKKMSSA